MAKKKNDPAPDARTLTAKQARKLARRLEDLVRGAQDAAARAEKAAKKARKQRKRTEAAAASLPDAHEEASPEVAAPADEPDAPAPAPAPAPAAPEGQPSAAGASVPASDLASATRKQLLDLARGAGLPGRSRMSKAELVAALGR